MTGAQAAGIETAATLAGKIAPAVATGATALYGQNVIENIFDQQNVGSQPFRGRKSGNSDFDSFYIMNKHWSNKDLKMKWQ